MTQERTTTRGLDPEIVALSKIDTLIVELVEKTPEAKRTQLMSRILTWLCDRHAPEDWAFHNGPATD